MLTQQSLSELYKVLMTPEQFADWERKEETRREFWRTLRGPAQRPLGSNADEWLLFLTENKDALSYLAVQIAEAIDEAQRTGRQYDPAVAPCDDAEFGIKP